MYKQVFGVSDISKQMPQTFIEFLGLALLHFQFFLKEAQFGQTLLYKLVNEGEESDKKKIVPLEVYILYSTEGYLKTAELRYK